MKWKSLLLAVVVSSVLSADCFWSPYLEGAARSNGYRQGAGLFMWVPVIQDECWLLYHQTGGGRWWDNWAVGTGLGYRQLFGEYAVGINGFLDGAYTDNHRFYGQASVGAELYACGFDLVANAYIPLDRFRSIDSRQESVAVSGPGNEVDVIRTDITRSELIYSGFDISVGGCVPICDSSLYLSLGYFYYSSHFSDRVAGPRLRAEYRIDDVFSRCGTQLVIGGEYEYNEVFGSYGSAVISLRIPLGCPGKAWCCPPCSVLRRMGDPASRAGGILVRERTIRTSPNDPGFGGPPPPEPCIGPDGEPVLLFYVSGNGTEGGTGTFEDPITWAEAEARATPYDIIALLNEVDIPATENFQMQLGQIMVGLPDENCPTIVTPCGPLDIPLSSTRPNVVYTGPGGEADVITVASEVQVFGFDIDGNSNIEHGLGGDDTDLVTICDVGVTNATSGGMFFQRPANMTILGSSVTDTTRVGMELRNPSGTITLNDNTIDNIGGGQPLGISIEDIRLGPTLNITNNDIDNVGEVGIRIVNGPGQNNPTTTLLVQSNTLDMVGDGILIDIPNSTQGGTDPVMTFDVLGNMVTDATGRGIALLHDSNDQDATLLSGFFRDNTLTRTTGDAISVQQDTQGGDHTVTIAINNNTIDDAGARAVFITRPSGGASSGTINATVGPVGGTLGNSDINSESGDPAYEFINADDGIFCLTLQGNNSDRDNSPDIQVAQSGGTFTVYRRDDLSADNNSLNVNVSGTVGTTNTPCPTP